MSGWKRAFDLGDRAYLDGANHGPLPRRSLAAAQRALGWKRDPATLDDRDYFRLPDRVRRAAAALLGCRPRDVALCTGASHGIGLVASGLDWRAGDRVLIPTGEFPANRLPWLALRERGVEVDVVPPDELSGSLGPRTRVVSVGHVNFADGRRLDVEAIGAECRRRGVLLVVDVAQSLGVVPFDVAAVQPAVVAAAGYKWLLCPYGTGLTYVRPDCVGRLRPPVLNWATVEGADDFNRLVDLEVRHRPGAVRFDVPETAAFIHGMAMAAALELLGEVGVERIFEHCLRLCDRIIDGLPDPFRVASPLQPGRRSAILRLVSDDPEHTAATWKRLGDAGVAVSLREGGLRVAPGMWNDESDVDRLLAGLG